MRPFRSHGFTLIELVMTIVVTTAIAIPASLLMSGHIENTFWVNESNFATNLARLEMERVKVLDYNNISNANFSDYLGYDYDVVRSVSILDPLDALQTDGEELKQINISVRKSGSADDLITLMTYIAKNVANGQ